MPKGQSPETQAERLGDGCCPIHGIPMSQVGTWYEPVDGRPSYTIVGCPRRDCNVLAKQSSPFGAAQLLPPGSTYPDPPSDMFGILESWLGDDPSRHDAVIAWLRRRKDAIMSS
jgi:hypothetical protein